MFTSRLRKESLPKYEIPFVSQWMDYAERQRQMLFGDNKQYKKK